MWLEWIIGVWCAAGILWAGIVWLLSSPDDEAVVWVGPETPLPALQIFKPIPPAAVSNPSLLSGALESFASQLKEGDTLRIGLTPGYALVWDSMIAQWRENYPAGLFTIVPVDPPPEGVNPKVDKLRQMASGVAAGFWVWSDADITAPAGYLDRVRHALAAHPNSLITGCYLVGSLSLPSALADAVVVNLQLNPGMKILARRSKLRGGVGALCAFDSRAFHSKCSFEHLSACLADDYELGKAFPSVQLIENPALHTTAAGPGWCGALSHALRWQRTIHWCDARGAALQIAVHPLIGLGAVLALRPSWIIFSALLGWLAFEALWAWGIFRRQGICLPRSSAWILAATGLLRTGLWLGAWLPRSVRWDQKPGPHR